MREMGSSTSAYSPSPSYSLLFFLLLSLSRISSSIEHTPIKDVDLEHPVLQVSPSPLVGYSSLRGAKDLISCERVRVAGLSRLKIRSYFNSFRVTVTPSGVILERLHSKIAICFHRNASLGLCQCVKDDWATVQNGKWSAVMSPYDNRYVDLKFMDGLSMSFTVSIEEEFHRWRLIIFAFGFVLMLLAPIFSNWVPFYYSSSMAIGVLLVVLVILFQGMKLLPTGRKNLFYLTIYGSVVGVGSFLVHYFSIMVNSILLNLGLSEDMYNPVSVFVLAGIILAGAALGYWIVRRFIISENGSVDVGIAQFVKWAMRIIAMTFIFQSSLDTPLAMVALTSCWGINFLITSRWRRQRTMHHFYQGNGSPWLRRTKHGLANDNRTEFLSKSANIARGQKLWNSPKRSYAWSDSPTKGLVLSSPNNIATLQQDFYSTFHKTPTRRKFSKKEWDEFTRESTRQAMAEWASSPEFMDWIVDNADRIRIDPNHSDDSMASGSDSSKETAVDGGSGLSFFKWY